MSDFWKKLLYWISLPLGCKFGQHMGHVEYTLAEGASHVCDGCGKVTR